ncbi:MAG: hypothetical protein ACRBF0_17155 [Calditrichia bacterium]
MQQYYLIVSAISLLSNIIIFFDGIKNESIALFFKKANGKAYAYIFTHLILNMLLAALVFKIWVLYIGDVKPLKLFGLELPEFKGNEMLHAVFVGIIYQLLIKYAFGRFLKNSVISEQLKNIKSRLLVAPDHFNPFKSIPMLIINAIDSLVSYDLYIKAFNEVFVKEAALYNFYESLKKKGLAPIIDIMFHSNRTTIQQNYSNVNLDAYQTIDKLNVLYDFYEKDIRKLRHRVYSIFATLKEGGYDTAKKLQKFADEMMKDDPPVNGS